MHTKAKARARPLSRFWRLHVNTFARRGATRAPVCVQLTRLEAENSKLREECRALEQECQALERDCQSLESEAAAALTEVDAVKFELAEAQLVAHKTQASHPIRRLPPHS